MKAAIHPTYHPEAKVTCAGCNTTYTVGSTKAEVQVELCSNCHPFYTGKQKLVDTAGRVERFQARQAKARPKQSARVARPAKPAAPAADDSVETPEARLAEMKKSLEQDAPTDN